MKMTPLRFLAFRLVNLTLCRFAFGDRLLRYVLLALFVSRREGDAYCQTAEYFSFDQLENDISQRRERTS